MNTCSVMLVYGESIDVVFAMDFSPEESCFIIEHYFRSKSCDTVRDQFHAKFGPARALNNATILRVVKRFQTHHTVSRKKESGCRRVHLKCKRR